MTWMRSRRFRGVLLVMILTGGCRDARVVRVKVLDAETKAPIEGALVGSRYAGHDMGTFLRPTQNESATDSSGEATLKIWRWPYGVFVVASARGYVGVVRPSWAPGDAMRVVNEVRESKSRGFPPDEQAMYLYKEPRPRVVLVLPGGFRGVVRVRLGFDYDLAKLPSGREWAFAVRGDGGAQLPLYGLLQLVPEETWQARFAGGDDIVRQADPSALVGGEVGMVALPVDDPMVRSFFIGTAEDFASIVGAGMSR